MKFPILSYFSVAAVLTVISLHIDALRPLIVGLNKYSHDASCCIMDSSTGKILFSQAKERISRLKHDGGAIGELLRYGLETIDASIDDIATVVSNNHHHRVLPFERRLPFYRGVKYTPEDYSDVMNLLPNAQHLELSHHLAHAWSVVGQSEVSSSFSPPRMRFVTTYRATATLNSTILLHSICSR
jgi:predicted NodU family carbamoyl transferase